MRVPRVERVDIAPVLQLLIGLTIRDGLPEGFGINGVPEQLGQCGLWGALGVEQTLPGGDEWTCSHETLLVNAILTAENRSPFSAKYYKMYYFV
jgi:hypothetical protein